MHQEFGGSGCDWQMVHPCNLLVSLHEQKHLGVVQLLCRVAGEQVGADQGANSLSRSLSVSAYEGPSLSLPCTAVRAEASSHVGASSIEQKGATHFLLI